MKFHHSLGPQEKILLDNGRTMYIPDVLWRDLQIFIDDMMYSEMDILLVVDGKEGTGKSRADRVLAKCISALTGIKFGPDNIHLTVEDYMNSSEAGGKFQVNVLDESREALNRRRSMAKSVVKFTNWLSENRDKQQVHIITLPAVHDLDSYITTWRMSMLIHFLKAHRKNIKHKSGLEMDRGYFRVYENSKDFQRVIHNRAKFGYYQYPYNSKYQRKLVADEPFTNEELKIYKDKKAQKRKEKYAEEEKKEKLTKRDKGMVKLVNHLSNNGWLGKEIAKVTNLDPAEITRIKKTEIEVEV